MQYLGYMTAAYTIIWVAILLYFLSLSRRERAIWRELQVLKETLRARGTGESQAAHQP